MKPRLLYVVVVVALGLLTGCVTNPPVNRAEVLATMEKAADWQLANPAKHPVDGWVQAAGYTGMMALADRSASPRFHDAMMKMAETNAWKPAQRKVKVAGEEQPDVYHADDHCVVQIYAELYFRHHDAKMIAPSRERFDYIRAHPSAAKSLEFVGPLKNQRWAWCDSLYMGPPAWLRLWKATGDRAYLDYAVAHWWETSDYLYDKEEHLYFRDSTYFKKQEANGKKVFWGRGNGWVMGGLVRMLQLLPADHPARPRFEQQFREMAAKLIALQQADGFWRASLLDPDSYPAKEASGTGFYCYAFTWGVNQGLLDRATYRPAALKAWAALTTCVQPDGKLNHVQPIGADPKKFDEKATEPYGVGAFLLAGSEIYRLR